MKKHNITLSIALAAVFSSSVAFAEAEVTGKIVHESASFTESGIGIGAAAKRTQTANSHGKDYFKQETTAKIYIDGAVDEVYEGATYHVEVNLMTDGKAISNYDSNESYTQRDALREAYIDAEVEDFSIRAGKQQVVWGTADGMKLLDAINPTDYSEMAQNQMEDSRMPIWMINAETDSADGASWQFIVSEAKSHKIAGLGTASDSATTHTNGDSGQAFIMKGVDTITGKVNGMMNIAPALGKVAKFFSIAGGGQLSKYQHATVNEFVNNIGTSAFDSASRINDGDTTPSETTVSAVGSDAGTFFGLCGGTGSANCLHTLANDTDTIVAGMTSLTDFLVATKGSNNEDTNLISSVNADYDPTSPDTAFELMDQTTFASFESFVDLQTKYVVDHPSASDVNTGLRYKNTTQNGVNWSVNYLNHYDSNPYVDAAWYEIGNNKGKLTPTYTNLALGANAGEAFFDYNGDSATQVNNTAATTTVTLKDSDGNAVANKGRGIGTGTGSTTGDVVELRLTERLQKINSLGGSFDTAVETAALGPVVIRGEWLYDRDVKVPVIDLAAINIGDLTEGLQSIETDFFKYVIGADITALTNMMISAQYIQLRNLDFIDQTGRAPTRGGVTSNVTGARYTGDMAAMHISNGLQKGIENKEFYSLFFSKPFGASGEHRWNNIFMYEENGGKWNRLDAEFSIDDVTQVTVEFNKYFGDVNTQFGQLAKSSNIQLGFKYSF
jgi:hypothetical protein